MTVLALRKVSVHRERSYRRSLFVNSFQSWDVIEFFGGGRDRIANDVRDLGPAWYAGYFGLIYNHTVPLRCFIFYVGLKWLLEFVISDYLLRS